MPSVMPKVRSDINDDDSFAVLRQRQVVLTSQLLIHCKYFAMRLGTVERIWYRGNLYAISFCVPSSRIPDILR